MTDVTFAEKLAGIKAEMEGARTDQDFWQARPYLKHIELAAHARQRSAPAVLGVVLARVAAIASHRIRIPPIVGADTGLSLLTVICAPPGVGKSSANHIGQQLVPVPFMADVADQLPMGTGEGLAEVFIGVVDETSPTTGKTVKVRRQVRHNAFVFVDEGQVLSELGSRKGSTLLPTLRTVFTGGLLGNTNASEERRRILPAGSYTIGIVVAMQTTLAGALLDDADGGTPQRMLWLPAIDPTIPDSPPQWPGPLPWQPPTVQALQRHRGSDTAAGGTTAPGPQRPYEPDVTYLDIADSIQEEIRAVDLARARGEALTDALDAHEGLLRLKVAGLLAILDDRLSVNEEDWQLASELKAMSDRMRATVLQTVAERNAQAEAGMSEKLARRAVHQETAVEQRKIVDCARKIAAKVWAEPDRWTVSSLRRDGVRRYSDVLEDGLEHAKAEGWVIEAVEAGQGSDKRCVRPGRARAS